jgi:lipooligosaccharide transport system permease protein
VINGAIVAVVVLAFGLATLPGVLLIPFIALLAGLAFGSIAMIFTALVPNIDSFNYPFFLFITPMFLFSGTSFPLTVLPTAVQGVALAFPLTHVATIMRDLCLGTYSYSDLWGCIYLIAITAVSFYAAIYLMKRRLVN